MADLHLGKTDHVHDPRDLRLAQYLDTATLPSLPPTFGHDDLVTSWGMLGNDRYGDCVWAGAGHEHELWTRESKTHADATFTDANVLAAYSAVTGFTPTDPSTDRGTDMRAAANYRRTHGIVDTAGHTHKIGAYVALGIGNLTHLDYAIYLFSAAGIGIQFPVSAMDQFRQGVPWDYVPGSKIEGGHYIVGTRKRPDGLYDVITWGKVQPATPRFLTHYMDEGLTYLAPEMLDHSHSIDGFALAALRADLAAV